MQRGLLIFFALIFMLIPAGSAQEIPAPPTTGERETDDERYIRSERLGITFISSAQINADDTRYNNALLLGAGWNRWPLYWNVVEPVPEVFDWRDYDRLVTDDIEHGLNINAILLGRPDFRADGERIANLNEGIFDDGSDVPGTGKGINPDNHWAKFVFEAVSRYRPGGTLAQQNGWVNGEGIRRWEMWNEPDLEQFWSASINHYARLLKVGYLAAHHADPNAEVMFGSLLYATRDNWLARVLAIYSDDVGAFRNNFYMDAVGVHSYSDPWRAGWLTLFADQTLKAYNLRRPIHVTEIGISVWDDYPGPVWTNSTQERTNLGTAEQQAWYIIQAAAYAWSEGATEIYFHQLYDDCGDQPAGTDFPPHNGELCTSDAPCFGNAFGLFRNEANSVCFSQHPNPGTPRPAATAYRLLAEIFGREPFVPEDDITENGVTRLTFLRSERDERIHVLWNLNLERNTALIPTEAGEARLHTLRETVFVVPENGNYQIPLNPAQRDNGTQFREGTFSNIGGEPVILIEPLSGELESTALEGESAALSVQSEGASGTPSAPIVPTAGSIIPNPNADAAPEFTPEILPDTTPPLPFVEGLPAVSPPTFTVRWGAQDASGIDRYVVWVKIDEGEWLPWLETSRTESAYTGEAGKRYQFAVWAVDVVGNWSANTDLQPMAETRVE